MFRNVSGCLRAEVTLKVGCLTMILINLHAGRGILKTLTGVIVGMAQHYVEFLPFDEIDFVNNKTSFAKVEVLISILK